MDSTEYLCNAILALTHPALFDAGITAIANLDKPEQLHNVQTHPHVPSWNSAFSGIGVISNRKTLKHRDSGGCPPWYDLLVSAGTHQSANVTISEMGATFSYSPGTVFMVCGKLLSHSIDEWVGGERICVAHYMRDMVHERLGVRRPHWCMFHMYTRCFNKTFREAHSWK
jgi:hypothetical protein